MCFDRLAVLSGSLKVRITAGFIASLVLAVGLTTLVLVSRAERDTLRDETRRELSATVRIAHELSRNMVEMQRALSLVAQQLDTETLGNEPALILRRCASTRAPVKYFESTVPLEPQLHSEWSGGSNWSSSSNTGCALILL